MSSCTDPLHFNEKRIFKEVKSGLPNDLKETRNILEIRDNVLYVWNVEKCCVLVLNVAASRGKNEDIPHQTLQPTDTPIFDVTSLLINETATQLALLGSLGIVLIELPKRWGKDTVFQGGKEVIICVSHNFGDFSPTSEIRRAKWHPGSTNDSHLLVLTSENAFRLYECEIGGAPLLLKCWKVGRSPSASPMKIPDFASLGEIAVDFDFATPTLSKLENVAEKSIDEFPSAQDRCFQVNQKIDWNQIEWPILVLRGNGEVLIIRGNILNRNYEEPVVLGSLSMYPPSYDNYGIDSCSIMCVQTTPPIVVIAMCTGKIYHAILLRDIQDDNENEGKSLSHSDSSFSIQKPEDALYVYECIEMELGLFFSDNDKKYNCPIHIHADPGNKSRYFCTHNAGIHMVSLPMVSQLEEYVNLAVDKPSDIHLPSLSNQSNSQYLICTRTKHTSLDETTPILGFGLLQEPCVLVALLHTGVVVDLSVIDLHYLPMIDLPEPTVNATKKVNKEPFNTYVRNMLMPETSQPITKLGSQNMTPREYLELLYRATNIFRKQHFVRHDKVRIEINKKVRALKALKIHLLKELDTLMDTKKELQQTAEHLAERYEDIKDKQEELARRAEEVLRLVNYKEPLMTAAERAEAGGLKAVDSKIHDLRIRLEQLKKKSAKQTTHLQNHPCSEKKKEIILSSGQEVAVKDNISQMSKEIKQLVSQVKKLEEDVGI